MAKSSAAPQFECVFSFDAQGGASEKERLVIGWWGKGGEIMLPTVVTSCHTFGQSKFDCELSLIFFFAPLPTMPCVIYF